MEHRQLTDWRRVQDQVVRAVLCVAALMLLTCHQAPAAPVQLTISNVYVPPGDSAVALSVNAWPTSPQTVDGLQVAVEYQDTVLAFDRAESLVGFVTSNDHAPLAAACGNGNATVIAQASGFNVPGGEIVRLFFRVLARTDSQLRWSCVPPVGLCPWYVHLANPSADLCQGDAGVSTIDGSVFFTGESTDVGPQDHWSWGTAKALYK